MKECKIALRKPEDILVYINATLDCIKTHIQGDPSTIKDIDEINRILSFKPLSKIQYLQALEKLIARAEILTFKLSVLLNVPQVVYAPLAQLVNSYVDSIIYPVSTDAVMVLPNNISETQSNMLKKLLQEIVFGKFLYRDKKSKFVYIISNQSHSDMPFKIGMTNSGYSRLFELNTANPTLFSIHALLFHDQPSNLERNLHSYLSNSHIEKGAGTEFFNCSSEQLKAAIQLYYPYPYVYSEQGLSLDNYLVAFKTAFEIYLNSTSSNVIPTLALEEHN